MLYKLIDFVVLSETNYIILLICPTNTNQPFDSPSWTYDLSLQLQQL